MKVQGITKFIGKGGVIKVNKGALIIMKGKKEYSRLYVLQESIITSDTSVYTFSLSNIDITQLWHIRLGHIYK